MSRAKLKAVVFGLLAGLTLNPAASWACTACYGQSDSPMARGMNAGIFTLLAVVVCVLVGIASFFVYIAKRTPTDKEP
jgi:hypothetical protein